MGLDVGDRTIGIAISDGLGLTAQPKETIRRVSLKEDIDRLVELILENNIIKIVIGLPLNMNGTLGPQGEKTQGFAQKLEKKLKYSDRMVGKTVEIVFWDERLTTASAQRALIEVDMRRENRRQIVDTVAAVFILQNYMDHQKNMR
ncbi:Holliday junction resolvase RuvX [Acidaminobacter sp.]|uniref:Holliday junction resolvase RuvX n=1 Tax=Acidaminobacter sp. TaxID=1872102 RepID=UPI0013812E9B|nr:Holliday junction resolvase RuvX [Acidaminobacter sp.]MDK9712365.1 Holliday junction resolvase RuvX [Acidaminobacter sp.]MZQ97607.1 Holliday junction resolvase RuvX [Acidaminobacter sp.]